VDITELLIFIGAIALLIIVHEFGHFLAAKFFGVEVEEFGLGFPPRALKLFQWRETTFSLNWIPLGGFVRPKGENDPNVTGGLSAASPWVRLVVFAAGPFANFLLAAVFFAVIFARVGVPDTSQVMIVGVNEGSPAEKAGLVPGDLLLEIGGQSIDSPDALRGQVDASIGVETLVIYDREGQTLETLLTPRTDPPQGEGAMGIFYNHPRLDVGLFSALSMGTTAVTDQIYQLLTLPRRIMAGSIAAEDARLVGFKGMYDIYQEVRDIEASEAIPSGINTLAFFASISISLGLLNLMPIPALDGGRILFTLPEIILRRRIPPNYENAINLVSFAMLILLMIYINIQDFVNPAEF
jgi:regulator of sigma E protease